MPKKPKAIPSPAFKVLCETCHYAKDFGAAELNAGLHMSQHSRRWHDHVVHVIRSEIIHTVDRRKDEIPLVNGFPF